MVDLLKLTELRSRRTELLVAQKKVTDELRGVEGSIWEETNSMLLDEALSLAGVEKLFQVIHVPSWSSSHSTAVLRSQQLPEYGFLCRASPASERDWFFQFTLPDGVLTGDYPVVYPYRERSEVCIEQLRSLQGALSGQGVRVVFMLAPTTFFEGLRYSREAVTVNIVEVAEWRERMRALYGDNIVTQTWGRILHQRK